MTKQPKIVYIIPTFNERENIENMLATVYKVLSKLKKYDFSILVVDDLSPDGTAEIVTKFKVKHPRLVLLSGPRKGLGQAMIRGINFAIRNLKADIVISNEADFSYSPLKVGFMLKQLENGNDVVFASRKIKNVTKWPISRQIIHFVANNVLAGFVAGVHEVEDHNSAFKAIRVKGILDKINFADFPKGFSFFNYLTFKLTKLTPNLYEFKTTFRPRTQGESKISFSPKYFKTFFRDSSEYIKNCVRIRRERNFV